MNTFAELMRLRAFTSLESTHKGLLGAVLVNASFDDFVVASTEDFIYLYHLKYIDMDMKLF